MMRDSIEDLRLVQEGLLRKLIAAGDVGVMRSQLVRGSATEIDRRGRSLCRLELAGMVRAERAVHGYQSNGSRRRYERWFALVNKPSLEHGLDEDGEPYVEGTRFD
jgi:hypothetical protein